VNGLHPLASRRWLVSYGAAALWALLLVVVVAHLVVVLEGWLRSVRYPFGLDYGEGIVWQQALLIPSARMYGAIRACDCQPGR
jgi:membrane protein YdbS with pleckstrin-like domain